MTARTPTGRPRGFRRAGRRTNLALLVLLGAAFGTGWLAFSFGTPVPATVATLTHGLVGLGVVVLVPWKTVIVRRARPKHLASWGLVGLVGVCLAAGFVEVFAGYGLVGGLSPIQVHVGAALVAVPLFVGHLLRHRQRRAARADLSRRNLLRTGGFAVGIGGGYAALQGLGLLAGLPSAARASTGSHRLAATEIPATNWLFDPVPVLPVDHRVVVAGRLFGVDDLAARAGPVAARLDCTSGWFAEATWAGVSLSALVPPDRLAAARSIEVVSVTGYTRRFPVEEAGSLWLAVGLEGRNLTIGSGAPVRLVAPHRRGFWWVKWVAAVRLSDRPAYAQLPFPPQ